MTMRWYAVQAFSGYEKLVQKGLSERIERSSLQSFFGISRYKFFIHD